eukprot:Clim_evm23s232 gene=Clim_evmTU23s232
MGNGSATAAKAGRRSFKEDTKNFFKHLNWGLAISAIILAICNLVASAVMDLSPRWLSRIDYPRYSGQPTSEQVTNVMLYFYDIFCAIIFIVPMEMMFVVSEPMLWRVVRGFNFWIASGYAVLAASFMVDVLKIYVSEPRPDFIARCFGNPYAVAFPIDDLSACTADTDDKDLRAGLKSYPSGHATGGVSVAFFVGLYYVWMPFYSQLRRDGMQHRMHQLFRITNGVYNEWIKQCLLTLLAVGIFLTGFMIGASRIVDFRHHPWDVNAGAILGMVGAIFGFSAAVAYDYRLNDAVIAVERPTTSATSIGKVESGANGMDNRQSEHIYSAPVFPNGRVDASSSYGGYSSTHSGNDRSSAGGISSVYDQVHKPGERLPETPGSGTSSNYVPPSVNGRRINKKSHSQQQLETVHSQDE